MGYSPKDQSVWQRIKILRSSAPIASDTKIKQTIFWSIVQSTLIPTGIVLACTNAVPTSNEGSVLAFKLHC